MKKEYHVPFIVNLVILIIILTIIYIAWHFATGYKLAVIVEKPNQEYTVIERDEATNLPTKIGTGRTHYEAIENMIDLNEVYDGLYNYIFD